MRDIKKYLIILGLQLFTNISFSDNTESIAGKLIGTWVLDEEMILECYSTRSQEEREVAIKYIASMTDMIMEITQDTMITWFQGQEIIIEYIVISELSDIVVIEETQGTQVGHKTIFKIMDDNHFEMLPPEGIVNYYVTILKRMETE